MKEYLDCDLLKEMYFFSNSDKTFSADTWVLSMVIRDIDGYSSHVYLYANAQFRLLGYHDY